MGFLCYSLFKNWMEKIHPGNIRWREAVVAGMVVSSPVPSGLNVATTEWLELIELNV